MEEKTWTVVLFTDDKSVEAVPSNWIQGEFCHWPSLATDKLFPAIRRCEPLNTSWPAHHVKIFRNGTFDDYGKARQKTKIAEDTSDLNTDPENFKRKRVQKILSSSESDMSDTILPSPPKPKKNRNKVDVKRKPEFSVSTILSGDKRKPESGPGTSQSVDVRKHHEPVSHTFSLDINYPSTSKQASRGFGEEIAVEETTLERESSSKCRNPACIQKENCLKNLTEQVHIVRGIVTDILSEMRNLKKELRSRHHHEGSETFAAKYANIKFPLTNDDELAILEAIIEKDEDFHLLVADLSKIGGTNCYNFVKRVLSTCLTNEMALTYSWLGRKGKKPFVKLNISKAVIYAAEKAGVISNRSDAEVAIQTWLKRASDRKSAVLNKKC